MKKKQQLEGSANRLINRLYRSKPRTFRQEGETSQQAMPLPSMHTESRQLVPKVNLKQKLPSLQPFEMGFRRSKVASFLEKKTTEARGLYHSTSKVKSRMYSSVQRSMEHQQLFPAVTVDLSKPQEKPEANYLTPDDFMQIIKLDKDMSEEFCYLRKKDGPYSWQIVDFQSRDPDEYMVISKRGLTKYVEGVGEFLSMEAFNAEARTYQRLMEIDYFKTYKKWKNFSVWKRLTKMNRLKECIRAIDNSILLSDETIKEGIQAVHLKCREVEALSIFYNQIMTVMTLAQFREYVQAQRNKTMEVLHTFDRDIIRLIEDTCNRSLDLFRKRMRIDREKGKETSEKKVPLVIGDETGKDMPYTEEATIKTQQLKLRNFIKLVDYLVLTAKTTLFKNSATELERVITETNTFYANRVGKGYGSSCWIRIEVEEHGEELFFVPAKSTVKDCIEEILFETVMEVCRTHTQFLHLPVFQVYTRQRDSERTDEVIELKNVINADQEFNRLIATFRHSVRVSLQNVEQHSHVLAESLGLLKRLRNLASANLTDKDSEYFRNELTAVRQELAKVRTIENEVEVGLYLFDVIAYKKLIEETASSVNQMLCRIVPELLHERSRKYLKQINANYKEVENSPSNLEAYFNFLDRVKDVSADTQRLQPDINDTIYLLSVADQFGLKPGDIIRGEVSEVNGQMIGLRRRLDEIGYGGQAMLEKFKKDVEKLVPTFDDRLKQHEDRLSALSVYKNSTNPYEKVAELNALARSLKQLNKDRQDLNRYQQALALQETPFENLDKFTQLFGSVEKMWKGRYEWDLLGRSTSKEQVRSLKLQVIKLKISEMDKVITECQRELEPNEVISDLRSNVETFRPLYNIMVNLNNEALLDNHREEIRQLVVVDTIEAAIKLEEQLLGELFKDMNSEVLTPEFLQEIKISRHSEAIQEITTKAIKEAELTKQLAQLEAFWKSNSLQVVLLHDNKDSAVLGVNDELIARIEDNLITTNNILASKYVGFIRPKVELQYRMLHYLHDLLDEWYHHQHTWMYLEPILKSPFAVKNLPKESNAFAQADAIWKRLMRAAKDNPSAKKYGDEHGTRYTLNQLRNNNASFEVLQKSLEEFLQKKRENFGRFFLLSNLQLLEILSNVKEHSDIGRYLGKVFQSVVDVALDERDTVTALKGPDGDSIPVKQAIFKGEVEEWFKLVEDMMHSSLRTMVRHEMAIYNSDGMERSKWIRASPPCQVMLAVDALAWTASTELFLGGEEDMDFQDWLQANNQQVQEQITMLKQTPPSHLHTSLTSLLSQNIHQRDITQALVGCESREDFKWQMRLRFYYEDDAVVVRIANAQSTYGYEYVGLYHSLTCTPQTDRYWFSIMSCLSKQKVAMLQGPHDCGKTQTYRQLALILAKNSMVFDCTASVTPSVLRKLLTGVSYMGSWICFEQVTNLPEEVLSVFAQHLFRIQEALALSMKDVRIGEKPLLLNPELGLVMTTRTLSFSKFPSNLLSEVRPVSIWLPDRSKLFETVLQMGSIADHKEITHRVIRFLDRCTDQLIEHPKFGMRDLLTIAHQLVKEGGSGRPTQIEQIIVRVLTSLVEVRFSSKDLPMWRQLLAEAFAFNAKLVRVQSIKIPRNLQDKIRNMYLVDTEELVSKVQQLQEMSRCKSSVIVTGGTMSGKSTVLKAAFEDILFVSPNCFSSEELLGRFEPSSGNWKDGLLPKTIKQINKETITTLVLDGQINASWAEVIAPLLDPTHSTTLASSEKLGFDDKHLRLCFESSNLSKASPAITTRCGVLYVSSSTVGYEPIVEADFGDFDDRVRTHFIGLVKSSYKKGIAFLRKNCREMVVGSSLGLLSSYCKLVRYQLKEEHVHTNLQRESWKKLAEKICIFAFTWSFGGVVAPESQSKFDRCLAECFSSDQLKTPMFNYFINYHKAEGEWVLWTSLSDNYQPEGRKFIPTKEAAVMKHMTLLLGKQLSPFLLMSPPGNGKSTAIRHVLTEDLPSSLPLMLRLPLFTTSKDLQQSVEGKLFAQRRSGAVSLLPPPGQKLICVIDDVNLAYSQATSSIELLRSLIESSVFWDRKAWTPKNVVDCQVVYTLSCNRQLTNLPERFLRHFNILYVPECEEQSLLGILNTFTKTLPAVNSAIENYLDSRSLALATVELFSHLKGLVSATPFQPQVVFNTHHMLEMFRNIERAFNPNKDLTVNQVDTLIRLWIHEARQTVVARLGTLQQREAVEEELKKLVIVTLKYNDDPNILFAENIVFSPLNINHYYSHVPNPEELIGELEQKSDKKVHLSSNFANHLFSAVRALSKPCGNYIVLAREGQGRSTIVEFAAKLLDLTMQIMLPSTKLLPILKKLCEDKKPLLLLLKEPHPRILEELMMLPRIPKEDQQEISKTTNAKSFAEIIERCLHIAVLYSPVQQGFRRAVRTLPCLTSLFSIDCWQEHTDESLSGIANRQLVSKSDTADLETVGRQLYRLAELTTIGQYFDLFQTYQHQYQRLLRSTQRKLNELTKAIGKFEQTVLKLKAIGLKMEEDVPRKDAAYILGEDYFQKLQKAQDAAIQYKQVLDVEEKQLEEETQKVYDEKRDIDRITAEMVAPIEHSATALTNLTRNELSEMKQLYASPNTPPDLRFALECIAITLQEKQDVDSIKKMISDGGFSQRPKQLDYYNIPKKVQQSLKTKLASNPSFRPAEMKAVNIVAKCICEWVCALNSFPDVYKTLDERRQAFQKLADAMNIVLKTVTDKRTHMEGLNAQIRRLQGEYHKCVEEKDALEKDIENATGQLRRGEQLIESSNANYQRWKTQLQKTQQELNNLKSDVFFACCETVILAGLDPGKRQEVLAKWKKHLYDSTFKLRERYNCEEVLEGSPKYRRILYNSSSHLDEHLLANLLYVQQTIYPLVLLDPCEWAYEVFSCDQQCTVLLEYDSATFEAAFSELMKKQRTTCIVRLQNAEQLYAMKDLLSWNLSLPARPEYLGKQKLVASPSFRWHFLLREDAASFGVTGHRVVNFQPSEQSIQHRLNLAVNRSERVAGLIETAKVNQLKQLENHSIVTRNEAFVLDAYATVASELFEEADLIAKIQQCSKTIATVLEEMRELQVPDVPMRSDLVKRLYQLYLILLQIKPTRALYRSLGLQTYLNLCARLKIESSDPAISTLQATIGIVEELRNHTVTRKHLLTTLFELSIKVSADLGVVSNNQIALLARSMSLRSSRQLLYEMAQQANWSNIRLKDWEVESFWQNPVKYCKSKEWNLSDFDQIVCAVRTNSRQLISAMQHFIKLALGVNLARPTQSFSIRQLYMKTLERPMHILDLVDDTAEINIVKEVQKLAGEAELTRFKVYSLGDRNMHSRIETSIRKSITDGGWTIMSNCHLEPQFALQKIADIQATEKIHQRFRLTVVHNSHSHLTGRYYIKSSFDLEEQMQAIIKHVPPLLVHLHCHLNHKFGELFRSEDLLEVYKLLEPLLKKKKLEDVWQEMRLLLVDYVYSAKLTSKHGFEYLGWLFDQYHDNSHESAADLNVQLIKPNELVVELRHLHPHQPIEDKYAQALKTCEGYLNRLPVAIKKKATPVPDKPLIGGATDYLEPYITDESELSNAALKELQLHLKNLKSALIGELPLDNFSESLVDAIVRDEIPGAWQKYFWASECLNEAFSQFLYRCEQLRTYLNQRTKVYELSVFRHPLMFLQVVLFGESRRRKVSPLELGFDNFFKPPASEKEMFESDGIYIKGILCRGFLPDVKNQLIRQTLSEEDLSVCPLIHLRPVERHEIQQGFVELPLHCETQSGEPLVLPIRCKTSEPREFWAVRGSCLRAVLRS